MQTYNLDFLLAASTKSLKQIFLNKCVNVTYKDGKSVIGIVDNILMSSNQEHLPCGFEINDVMAYFTGIKEIEILDK